MDVMGSWHTGDAVQLVLHGGVLLCGMFPALKAAKSKENVPLGEKLVV
jgi:hypothetical protein